jgi:hypothetical protein
VVVDDCNVERITVSPTEANAPLIVHADAVLSGSVALQSLQAVPRWNPQILKPLDSIELHKLSKHGPLKLRGEPPGADASEETLGLTIGEASDHEINVTQCVTIRKRGGA